MNSGVIVARIRAGGQVKKGSSRPSPLFEPIQELEHKYADHGVGQRGNGHVAPTPLLHLAKQAMRHAVIDPLVGHEKEVGDDEARAGILDVNFQAQRRRQVPDDRQGNAVHAQGMAGAGEEVLHQANRAAREASADRIAPGHREEDGDHERQTDRRQEWNLPQNENLDQYRNQGNEDDRGPTEFVDRDLVAVYEFSWPAIIFIPLVAVLIQIFVLGKIPFLAAISLPFMVTIFFAVARRNPISGCLTGCAIGLMQDLFAGPSHPLGMYGIALTIIGYLASSLGLKIDVENPGSRFIITYLFFVAHQGIYYGVAHGLLGQVQQWSWSHVAISALANAVIGIFVFKFLDRFKQR